MIRIVLTSDNHLNRYYAKMSRDQLRQRRRKLREAWRQTVDFAIEHRAHFYLHAGDLFDQPDPSPGELASVAREFQRLRDAGVQVLCISGNHDMPRIQGEGSTPVRIYEELRAARVFIKRSEIEFDVRRVDGQSIAIGGLAPDPRLDPDSDPLGQIECKPPPADVAVLLLHCGVEDAVPTGFGEAVLRKSTIARMQDISLFMCGDVHHHNRLDVGDATVLIPGATERMTFGEEREEPGFFYLELDGKRLHKAVRHTIVPQPLRTFSARTTELTADDPTQAIANAILDNSHLEQLFQMRLEGPLTRDLYHALRWFDLWRVGAEHNFFFDLDRSRVYLKASDEAPVPSGETARVSTAEELERVADELIDQADSLQAREMLEEARELVLTKYRDK